MAEQMPHGGVEKSENPIDALLTTVDELAKSRNITRDQQRLAASVLSDQKFATLANRTLNQGADPAWLLVVTPESVKKLADSFGLSSDQVEKTIASLHSAGPGALIQDSPEEFLWLILAKYSVDEAQKSKDPTKVVAASARKMVEFENYVAGNASFENDAREYRKVMIEKIQSVGDAPLGNNVPLFANDLGFYIAYRSGHSVAAVRAIDGTVYYGTNGTKTLEEADVQVDKALSPHFGIVFAPKAE
jgi:hypothetical protein